MESETAWRERSNLSDDWVAHSGLERDQSPHSSLGIEKRAYRVLLLHPSHCVG